MFAPPGISLVLRLLFPCKTFKASQVCRKEVVLSVCIDRFPFLGRGKRNLYTLILKCDFHLDHCFQPTQIAWFGFFV